MSPERYIAIGAALSALGIAIAGTAPIAGVGPGLAPPGTVQTQQVAGGVVLLAGWVAMGLGIHRFGRKWDARHDGEGDREGSRRGDEITGRTEDRKV